MHPGPQDCLLSNSKPCRKDLSEEHGCQEEAKRRCNNPDQLSCNMFHFALAAMAEATSVKQPANGQKPIHCIELVKHPFTKATLIADLMESMATILGDQPEQVKEVYSKYPPPQSSPVKLLPKTVIFCWTVRLLQLSPSTCSSTSTLSSSCLAATQKQSCWTRLTGGQA